MYVQLRTYINGSSTRAPHQKVTSSFVITAAGYNSVLVSPYKIEDYLCFICNQVHGYITSIVRESSVVDKMNGY